MDGDIDLSALKVAAPYAGLVQDYRSVTQHGVFPETTHDEVERFNFLFHLNHHVRTSVLSGTKRGWEGRVEPEFIKQNGRAPKNRHEVHKALMREPTFQAYSALRRAAMEQRQQAGRSVALRQSESLRDRVADLTADDALQLNPDLEIPRYVSSIHHHCMPGSYYGDAGDGDVVNAANYDVGFYATFGGAPLMSGPGEGMVSWLKAYRPDFKPKRILDVGSTIGHNLLPMAAAFPDADVVAVDVGAPVLRYGLARARALGVDNISWVQADGTDLSMFADESFDLIQSCLLLHETSHPAMLGIFKENYRLLTPGGLVAHVDVPGLSDDVPIFEQAMRDWDAFYNNEPFMSTLRDIDVFDVLAAAGFKKDHLFHAAGLGYGPSPTITLGEGRMPSDLTALPGMRLMGASK